MTWNEFLDHLKGEVQDKSKNPFFGAFIATWVIRHWEVVFTFFYFDEEIKLDEKLKRLNSYFDSLPEGDFWYTILYTFCVILLGYLLLNLARVISNLSEKILTPLIYKWTAGKASIVTKETYDQALLWEKNTKAKLELQIKENETLRTEVEDWEKRYRALNQQLIEKLKNEKNEEVKNTQTLKSQEVKTNEKPKTPETLISQKITPDELKPFAKATYDRLDSSSKVMLDQVIRKIKEKEVIEIDHYALKPLVSKLIVEQVGKAINGFAHFRLTELGEEIKKIFNL